MTIYYIDSENVHTDCWASVVHKLPSVDRIILFDSPNANKVPLGRVPLLKRSRCSVEVVPCKTGTRNAMDFVIVTKLGEMCYRCPKSDHVIISNDAGYVPAQEYWLSRGVHVTQRGRIVLDESGNNR